MKPIGRTARIFRPLSRDEDIFENSLEVRDRIPVRYPEGRPLLIAPPEGLPYVAIRFLDKWYKITLSEVT